MLPRISNANLEALSKKIDELYARMGAAKIKTSTPATRAELNEASNYMRALSELLDRPMSL
jgi:hypothetical protein